MKKGIKFYGVLFLVLFISACNGKSNYFNKQLDTKNRIHEIETQKFLFTYSVKIGNELSNAKSKLNENTYWVRLNIASKNSNQNPLMLDVIDYQDYQNRLNYFLNIAEKNIQITNNNGEVLPILSYSFENSYNLKPSCDLLVCFDNSEIKSKEIIISYFDDLFGNGIIKTTYLLNS
jgi:hypothetical protein